MKKSKFLKVLLYSAVLASCSFASTSLFAATEVNFTQLDMPIIFIDTNDQPISSKEDYVNVSIDILEEEGAYQMEDMNVSIRLRGNSTLNAPKKSYRLKFDKKQNMLNLGDGSGKSWNLIANYYDTSLLRNFATYHFADRLTGMPYTQNSQSVEVYVDGEYQGVYLLCEAVNINKNRINITEAPDEVENNGYLLEMTRYIEDPSFGADTETYVIKNDLSETESIKTEQINYISNYVDTCIEALKAGNKEEVMTYIDIDSLVDIYIANEIVKNVDTGWDSFYMFKDAGGKLCFGPVWDFDLALGNADCVKGFDKWQGLSAYTVLNVNANSNPWLCYALSCDWFRELVQDRWNALQGEINALPSSIIEEAEANYDSYSRNFEKWDVLGKKVYIEPSYIAALDTFEEHYMYLSDWIANRTQWLTDYYNTDEFLNGIFLDENGNILSADSNLLAVSSLLAYSMPPMEMTYTLTENTGMVLEITKGGTASWSGQALATGFMLEEGETYTLSFDYSCTKPVTTSITVQENHDRYKAYHADKVTLTNDLQHYEATFTATADDTNCAFTLGVGDPNFEGTIVTVDNLCLKKTTPVPKSPLTATLEVVNDWKTGAIYNMTITNASEEAITEGWTVNFDFNRNINNLWNAHLISSSDNNYTVTNPSWRPTLAPGESYTFSFQVDIGGDDFEISNITFQ